jgi:hypothetical protein
MYSPFRLAKYCVHGKCYGLWMLNASLKPTAHKTKQGLLCSRIAIREHDSGKSVSFLTLFSRISEDL